MWYIIVQLLRLGYRLEIEDFDFKKDKFTYRFQWYARKYSPFYWLYSLIYFIWRDELQFVKYRLNYTV